MLVQVHPINAENDIEAIIEEDIMEETIISGKITSSQVLQMYVEDEEDLYTSLDFSNSGMYKTTRVGDDYQAEVPDAPAGSLAIYDPHYGAPDTLLWDPSHLSENQVTFLFLSSKKIKIKICGYQRFMICGTG